jgi:preprotein translocase subunit SecY
LQKFTLFRNGELSSGSILVSILVICLSLYVVSFIESSFRNIPIQYAKKTVNNKQYGGTQNLPLRLDTGGVMPPILASSLLAAPATLANFVPKTSVLKPYVDIIHQSLMPGQILFNLVFAFLIIYMSFFYAPIQFKTKKIAESLQKNNAFVPGIRPGEKTQEYLDYVLNRVTFFGALFLIVVCIFPSIITKNHSRFEGTSLLIMVSVAMRVMLNVQTFMYSDKYETAFKSRGKYNGPNRRF